MDQSSESDFEEKTDPADKKQDKKTIDEAIKHIVTLTLHDQHNSQSINLADYSLKPDIDMGYKPILDLPGAPIPLSFNSDDATIMNTIGRLPIIYKGFRPKDTYEMHEALGKNYPFKITDKLFALMKEVNAYSQV